MSDLLLNKAAYFLEVLAWQNSKDASEKPPKNVPIYHQLPGMEEQKKKKEEDPNKEIAMDIDDLKAFLSRPRESGKVEANE